MKQELLNNPEVQQIANQFVKYANSTPIPLWSDFVKAQKPKEWEIQSFVYKKDKEYLKINNDGTYSYINSLFIEGGIPLESMLHEGECVDSGHFEVHSVKRLSDGEVFTVGDKVDASNCNFTIKGFYVTGTTIVTVVNGGYLSLGNMTKAQPCLFTTEDNVEIHSGDMAFGVAVHATDNDNIRAKRFSYQNPTPPANRVWFFSEDAAKEYLIHHKPCFSFQDLKDFDRQPRWREGYDTAQYWEALLKIAEIRAKNEPS